MFRYDSNKFNNCNHRHSICLGCLLLCVKINYETKDDIDFVTIEQKVDGKNKGRFTGTEYMLTVDTAKNVCMWSIIDSALCRVYDFLLCKEVNKNKIMNGVDRMDQIVNSWWFNLIMIFGVIAMPIELVIALACIFMAIRIGTVLFDKYKKGE